MDLQDGVSVLSLVWLIVMLERHYGVLLPGAGKSVEDGDGKQGCNSSCSDANQKLIIVLSAFDIDKAGSQSCCIQELCMNEASPFPALGCIGGMSLVWKHTLVPYYHLI